MKETFQISTIIPVYNGAPFLTEAINSVLHQTLPPDELLVIDDGSTDDTAQIAQSFGDKVLYFYQENQGAAAARNHGIKLAQGNLIAFLDADDLWLRDKLKQQVERLIQQPACGIVFTFIQEFKTTTKTGGTQMDIIRNLPGYSFTTALIRQALFEKIGFFDTQLAVGEFIDWYAQAKDMGYKDCMLEETLALRRSHEKNMTKENHNNRQMYPHVIKNILDRRRKASNKKLA